MPTKIKIFQAKCKHRHTAATHPHCFVDGKPVQGGYEPKNKEFVKALIFDIETLPGLFSLWGTGKQYVSAKYMKEPPMLLAWSAKWLYDDKVYGKIITPKQAKNRDSSELMDQLWQLMNTADILIGHNIKGFDIPRTNTWMLKNGFPPPMFYKIVDTLTVAKANFELPSYSLDYINEYFGLAPKTHTTVGLWDRCEAGDKDALDEMLSYNKDDVLAEEETYTFLRPWMSKHPELSIYADSTTGGMCKCGSKDIALGGYYATNRAKYQAYRCNDCGAIGRFYVNLLAKKKETTENDE